MAWSPPTSTLFPYTTLFRSLLGAWIPVRDDAAVLDRRRRAAVIAEPARDHDMRRGVGALIVDRKSTRLNSSHANISYAVFCLKKKRMLTLVLGIIDWINDQT